MSKKIKILTTVIMVIMILATIGNVVFGVDTVITNFNPKVDDTSNISSMGEKITGVLQVIGVVVAVIILTVVGIKYMMGSAEEKAEYKKVMIPYIVGAVLVFSATSIVRVVYQLISQNLKI